SGSLFRRDGFDPKLIKVNTSTEYWQKRAALLTTYPLGTHDVELPANARVFMIAGTQHAGRVGLTPAAGPCANPRNPHNPSAALRALLVDLDDWVSKGIEPPASRVPRLADGTLVAADATGFPAIPEFHLVHAVNAIARFGDWVHPHPEGGQQYRPLVAKVGADGNEVAGILLPDIAAPLATYTGWNAYKLPFPEGELCDRDGSYAPLAKTRAERLKSGDPRPSLEEIYGDHAGYVAKLTAAAEALVSARLLLPEDARRYIEAAKLDKTL
ncbi:MAG TPA: alpha/beta hydrolase domain-containing protein, partial [Stellaceae bacterium]